MTMKRPKALWKYGAILAVCLLFSFGVLTDEKDRAAIANALADPLSLLDQRSPGARGAGALAQSKPRRQDQAGPSERVLSNVRVREPNLPPIETDDLLTDLPDYWDTMPTFAAASPNGTGSPTFGGPSFGGVGGPGVIGGGDGSSGPPPGGDDDRTTPPKPPVVPIPEPATWLTMIIGFATVGWALRRGRTRRAIVASRGMDAIERP